MIDTSEDVPARLATRDDRILCGGSRSCRSVVGSYRGGVLRLPDPMTEMFVDGRSTSPRSFRVGKNAEGQQAQGNSGARTRSTKRLPGDQDYVVPSYRIGTVGGSDVIRVKCPTCPAWNRIDQAALYDEALKRIH